MPTFEVMEFFTSTGFYCLAVVLAVALMGMLLHQQQLKPAETYIVAMQLLPAPEPCGNGEITLTVMPDGTVSLLRTGIGGPPQMAVNLVADLQGDKLRITEKLASRPAAYAAAEPEVPLTASASLRFLRRGRWAIRYESEITGTWCTASLLFAEGNSVSAQLRY